MNILNENSFPKKKYSVKTQKFSKTKDFFFWEHSTITFAIRRGECERILTGGGGLCQCELSHTIFINLVPSP